MPIKLSILKLLVYKNLHSYIDISQTTCLVERYYNGALQICFIVGLNIDKK